MSIAKFIPAVTETKTVEVAPAKITLELTVSDSQVLRALLGETCGPRLLDLFTALESIHERNGIEKVSLAKHHQSIQLDTVPYAY